MENFNNPYIDRLIGVPLENAEEIQKWHEYIIENVTIIGGEKIEHFEIEKKSKDIDIINFTEIAADRIMNRYGRVKHIIMPLNNIHLLKDGGTADYTKGRLIAGAHSITQKSIIVDRVSSDVQFSLILFHELMHLKSYSAVQVIPTGEKHEENVMQPYRSGISVMSRDGITEYLVNVEEAIIGYLTSVFYDEVIKQTPQFKQEFNNASSDSPFEVSRKKELGRLNEVIDFIYQKHQTMFSSREKILDLFIDAQVNGNLFSVSRLVKDTFGLESIKEIDFRKIE